MPIKVGNRHQCGICGDNFTHRSLIRVLNHEKVGLSGKEFRVGEIYGYKPLTDGALLIVAPLAPSREHVRRYLTNVYGFSGRGFVFRADFGGPLEKGYGRSDNFLFELGEADYLRFSELLLAKRWHDVLLGNRMVYSELERVEALAKRSFNLSRGRFD